MYLTCFGGLPMCGDVQVDMESTSTQPHVRLHWPYVVCMNSVRHTYSLHGDIPYSFGHINIAKTIPLMCSNLKSTKCGGRYSHSHDVVCGHSEGPPVQCVRVVLKSRRLKMAGDAWGGCLSIGGSIELFLWALGTRTLYPAVLRKYGRPCSLGTAYPV